MNDIEKLLDQTTLPSVKVPYFRERLRSRLLDHPCWLKRTYGTAFGIATVLAGGLALLLVAFVAQPEYAQRLHVALGGKNPVSAEAIGGTVAPAETRLASLGDAGSTSTVSRMSRADLVAASREMTPPPGALRLPASGSSRELEIVRRLAAAASDSRTIDARPVGSVRMREYELNNGQRMMVVDQIKPKSGAVKCIYY